MRARMLQLAHAPDFLPLHLPRQLRRHRLGAFRPARRGGAQAGHDVLDALGLDDIDLEIGPDELRKSWRNGFLSTAYFLILPWKAWPTSV